LLLFLAALVHNAEEGVGYPFSRPEAMQLAQSTWPAAQFPTVIEFQMALVIFTAAVGAVLAWAANTRREPQGWLALKLLAWVFLANVIVPHVPAAILLGGYAPGVITAVAINLPLSLWILQHRREPSS
jgi:hypothetical protein